LGGNAARNVVSCRHAGGIEPANKHQEASCPQERIMLYYAVVFLVIALIAAVLGFGGIAASAAGIAKVLFVIFAVLAIAGFVASLLRRR
jgi:uncharacterized membrane protein YtjA (UPF0391 family)